MLTQETLFVGGPLDGVVMNLRLGTRETEVVSPAGFPLKYEPGHSIKYAPTTYTIKRSHYHNSRGKLVLEAYVAFAPGWD